MKLLIEIHVIQNYAPSCLNRDDNGSPKDAIFGGTRRARISSQCLKKAVRNYFCSMLEQNLLEKDDLASRTKRILDALAGPLIAKGRTREEAEEKVRLALGSMGLTVKEDGKSEYLLFLGQREIAGIAEIIHEKWEAISTPEKEAASVDGKKPVKAKKQAVSSADPELKKALDKVVNGGKALDVALFGRMLADMPHKNQDAACQVAHALSTHVFDREFDFYTAVDDLKPDDTTGADMIGTTEFNSACFYRYAMVDWTKLVQNLQGDKELAKKGLRAFLSGFVVTEPTGRQSVFAAHNPPEFVAISVRRNTAPRNLANAFENALRVKKGESITRLSADRLVDKANQLQVAYGGEGLTYVLNLVGTKVDDFGKVATSLEALLNESMSAVGI